MTEQDKAMITRLWESGLKINEIARLLPYHKHEARRMIKELRATGQLKPTSGLTKNDQYERIGWLYKGGMTNPYDIAEEVGLKGSTVRVYLSRMGVLNGRPAHNYKKRKPQELADSTKAIMVAISNGDKTLTEIGKDFGVSRQRVSQIKKTMEERGDND